MRPHPKAREAVKLAATQTEIASVKRWLLDDPESTWERRATELYAKAEANPRAKRLTAEDIATQIAEVIVYQALTAELRVERARLRGDALATKARTKLRAIPGGKAGKQ